MTFLISPSYAQVTGTDTTPGAACSVEDSVQMTANPSGTGGYVLTCEGGVWVATLNASTPTANEQVATKEYVDTAVAAGGGMACYYTTSGVCGNDFTKMPGRFTSGGSSDVLHTICCLGSLSVSVPVGCDAIGDVCDDGSIFAGDGNMYVTDVNQSTSSGWKTSAGTDDINPDSNTNGQANHNNRSGTLSDFPAFELCENLNRHGYTDWYLPAKDELNVLYTNSAAIGGFTTGDYWSSTEDTNNFAWFQTFSNGNQNDDFKTDLNVVRCVRRN